MRRFYAVSKFAATCLGMGPRRHFILCPGTSLSTFLETGPGELNPFVQFSINMFQLRKGLMTSYPPCSVRSSPRMKAWGYGNGCCESGWNSSSALLLYLLLSIYLFGRERERYWFSICWFTPQWPQQPGLGEAKVRRHGFHPDFPHLLLLSQVH